MKDFDFDELDRAVSSALGGQAAGSDSRSAEEARVPQVSSVSPAGARAQNVVMERGTREEAPLEVPERVVESPASGGSQHDSSPKRRSAPARPQTGRFMDVVHPSTDMRQSTPLSEVVLADEVPEVPAQEVSTPPRQEVPMNDFRMVPRREIVRMPAPKRESSPEVVAEEGSWEPPVDSPFLPDAKVEKRPLGASEPTGFGDVAPAVVADSASEDKTPLGGEFPDFEQTSNDVNDEVHADVVGSPVDSVVQPVDTTPIVTEDTPVVATSSADDANDILLDSIEAELVPEFDVVHEEPQELVAEQVPTPTPATARADISEYVGPVEITPQYTSKPSSAEQSGEIFDTESYHQPFAAPVKKKGGALKITLILLLIIALGAGVGVVVYLYILPML